MFIGMVNVTYWIIIPVKPMLMQTCFSLAKGSTSESPAINKQCQLSRNNETA